MMAPRHDFRKQVGMDIPQSIDGERLIAVFTSVVEQLGQTLPKSYELVLHDLSRLPNSIVAISGEVTRRAVGDPATDLLLEQAASGTFRSRLAYDTQTGDGRKLRSSTLIVEDVGGRPVAALCMNADLTLWDEFQRVTNKVAALNGAPPFSVEGSTDADPVISAHEPERPASASSRGHESFVHDVDELASILIGTAIRASGVPVDLMQKQHKLEIVRDLKARGLFMLKDAVQLVAGELGVTRFTIYNYLNQLADEEEHEHRARNQKGHSNEQ